MLALLAPLASLLGIEVATLRERLQRHALIFGAVGIFIAIAVVFVLVAINTALTFSFGPVIAPLMIAGASLLVALGI
jgi:hypothetical protein